jgi:hypothetical protein
VSRVSYWTRYSRIGGGGRVRSTCCGANKKKDTNISILYTTTTFIFNTITMPTTQQYDLYSQNANENLNVYLIQLPQEMLKLIEQNPSEASITFITDKYATVQVQNKEYTFKIYKESKNPKASDVDLYSLNQQTKSFKQVGFVRSKLMLDNKTLDDEFTDKIKRETIEKNQKDKAISVISPGAPKRAPKVSTTASSSKLPTNGSKKDVKRKKAPNTVIPGKKARTNGFVESDTGSESAGDGDGVSVSEPPNSQNKRKRHKFHNLMIQSLSKQFEELEKIDFVDSSSQLQSYTEDVKTVEQYENLSKIFEKKYAQYSLIHERLSYNYRLFEEMTKEYERLDDEQEKNNLLEKIKQLYKVRSQEVKKFKQKYCSLHDELKQIKETVSRFLGSNK